MAYKKPGSSRDDKAPKSDGRSARKSGEIEKRASGAKRSTSDKPYRKSSDKASEGRFAEDKERRSARPYGERGTRAPGKSSNRRSPENSFGEQRQNEKPSFRKSTGERPFKSRGGEGKFQNDNGDRTFKKPFRKDDKSLTRFQDESKPQRTMRSKKAASAEPEEKGLIRLNRYISNAGICSRRKADELIQAGVISVNGEVVSELGFKVDPSKDTIRYNGETLKREKMVYVLLNKPKDYITTTDDPQERRTVMHLVEKASKERIYPVGRLDRNTTGLLLMTNDGDLADKLSHPRNNVLKLYQVELDKSLTQGDLNKIAFGLELEDGLIKPDMISYVQGGTKREVGIQIHSGKNRIVRRIFEHLGYEVVKLDRAVYANLTKKDLPRGRWRYLEEKEVIQLKHLLK